MSSMAKVYMIKLVDKKTKKVFYKFGHTTKSDVLERFNVKYDPRYGEFEITCIASQWGTLEWCKGVEHAFKAMFPKNIWLEEFFGDGRKWDNFSGITEVVYLTEERYNQARQMFYRLKDQLKKEEEWANEYAN